jgi:hypothetical protein
MLLIRYLHYIIINSFGLHEDIHEVHKMTIQFNAMDEKYIDTGFRICW